MKINNNKQYFKKIEDDVQALYHLAEECRKKNLDPVNEVEVVLAKDMAERVVGLISVVAPKLRSSSLVPRIKELEKK